MGLYKHIYGGVPDRIQSVFSHMNKSKAQIHQRKISSHSSHTHVPMLLCAPI